MAAAMGSGSGVAALARKAPIAMPGQTPRPKMTRAASAMPVGGQTSEMLCPIEAKRRPSRAAA